MYGAQQHQVVNGELQVAALPVGVGGGVAVGPLDMCLHGPVNVVAALEHLLHCFH